LHSCFTHCEPVTLWKPKLVEYGRFFTWGSWPKARSLCYSWKGEMENWFVMWCQRTGVTAATSCCNCQGMSCILPLLFLPCSLCSLLNLKVFINYTGGQFSIVWRARDASAKSCCTCVWQSISARPALALPFAAHYNTGGSVKGAWRNWGMILINFTFPPAYISCLLPWWYHIFSECLAEISCL